MLRGMRSRPLLAAAAVLATAGVAAAQPKPPSFEFGKADEVAEVKEVEWTASAEAGLVLTTGNSETTTATAAGKVIRLDPRKKLEANLALTYARSTILIASDVDGSGAIGPAEIVESTSTTANAWQARARYDRFLTELNSAYVTGSLGADRPAGKEVIAGGQVGYSRALYKSEEHLAVAEVGYDFSYEDLVTGDPLPIHSARALVGYTLTRGEDTAFAASVEALANLNRLPTVPEEAAAFDDLRVNAQASVTAKLTADIAIALSIAAKYDRVPAPRAPFGAIPYEPGFVPLADTLDTVTKASLIVTLF